MSAIHPYWAIMGVCNRIKLQAATIAEEVSKEAGIRIRAKAIP